MSQSVSEILSNFRARLGAIEGRVFSITPSTVLFSAIGEVVLYGCKVTQGVSAVDMVVALEGQASGDTANHNPDYSVTPSRPFQYGNIANGKDGSFESQDLTATVATAPVGAGTARYDIAYIYVGTNGPGFAIASGTPSSAVKTDFDTNGLNTDPYDSGTDAALPVGAMPVGRIYVEVGATGIANARIADIRPLVDFGAGASGVTSLSITQPAAGLTITNTGSTQTGVVTYTLALAGDLAALEGLATNGMPARIGTSNWAVRTLTSANTKLTITSGDGVAGNPTFTINEANFTGIPQSAVTLATDLAALEAMSTNGIAIRSGTSTWLTRSIASANSKLTVTNADGISGNPTLTINEANFTGIPQSAVTSLTSDLTAKQPNIQFKDDGTNQGASGAISTIDFVGAGVSAVNASGTLTVTVSGGGSGNPNIQFKEDGTNVGTAGAVSTVDFTGVGVTASYSAGTLTVNVPGGAGQGPIQFKDEGTNKGTSGGITTVNFTGAGITATDSGGVLTVDVPGTGAVSSVTLTQPAAGLTITNSGTPQTGAAAFTFALAGDLSSLEGLSTTGIGVRSGTNTWLTRSIASANSKITVSNASGASGDPTLTINEANFTGIPQSAVTSLTSDLAAKQAGIQFKDETTNLGASATVTSINFAGAGVTASRSTNEITVTIPGGGAGISNFTSGSTSVTLTTTPTYHEITPASIGVVVRMPAANTVAAVTTELHIVDNLGVYPVVLMDNTNQTFGFLPPGKRTSIALKSIATAAGRWRGTNLERLGISAELTGIDFAGQLSVGNYRGYSTVDLDGDIELIFSKRQSDGHVVGVAHRRSTGAFGSVAVIRALDLAGNADTYLVAAKHTTTQALVVTCPAGSNSLQALPVAVNTGTLALTPGTGSTQLLSGNISRFIPGCGLVKIPSLSDSFVVTYKRASNTCEMRGISISGTTASMSAGGTTTMNGQSTNPDDVHIIPFTDKILEMSLNSTTGFAVRVSTISGNTITTNSSDTETIASGTGPMIKAAGSVSGGYFCIIESSTGLFAVGVSVTGTTPTSAITSNMTSSLYHDSIIVNNKILVTVANTSNNLLLVTITAGAPALAGFTSLNSNVLIGLYVEGSFAIIMEETGKIIAKIDCSSTSPVVTLSTISGVGTSVKNTEESNVTQTPSAKMFVSGNQALSSVTDMTATHFQYWAANSHNLSPVVHEAVPARSVTLYRGRNDAERWGVSDASNALWKLEMATV
jgi:hypothetical protein